jgi:hypothetical protein
MIYDCKLLHCSEQLNFKFISCQTQVPGRISEATPEAFIWARLTDGNSPSQLHYAGNKLQSSGWKLFLKCKPVGRAAAESRNNMQSGARHSITHTRHKFRAALGERIKVSARAAERTVRKYMAFWAGGCVCLCRLEVLWQVPFWGIKLSECVTGCITSDPPEQNSSAPLAWYFSK